MALVFIGSKTTYNVPGMDCPSEERMVRLRLEGLPIARLDFDLTNRRLTVYHNEEVGKLGDSLHSLKLGSTLLSTEIVRVPFGDADSEEKRPLVTVLAINLTFFLIEAIAGTISNSMGLVADSLDMLADSFVYGLGLLAVGKAAKEKRDVAKASGYLQMTLALVGLTEVLRRSFGYEAVPEFRAMVTVSAFALLGNAACLYILQRSKDKGVHIRAGMVFTSNDVVANLGVILAGGLVWMTSSNVPDLLVGVAVFVLVARGAFRILALAKQ